jgi:hypothetical protein
VGGGSKSAGEGNRVNVSQAVMDLLKGDPSLEFVLNEGAPVPSPCGCFDPQAAPLRSPMGAQDSPGMHSAGPWAQTPGSDAEAGQGAGTLLLSVVRGQGGGGVDPLAVYFRAAAGSSHGDVLCAEARWRRGAEGFKRCPHSECGDVGGGGRAGRGVRRSSCG